MSGKPIYPQGIKDRAIRMRSDGVSIKGIARELGVGRHTVRYWVDPDWREAKLERGRERHLQRNHSRGRGLRRGEYPQEFRDKVLRDHAAGELTQWALAKKHGVSPTTLKRWVEPDYAKQRRIANRRTLATNCPGCGRIHQVLRDTVTKYERQGKPMPRCTSCFSAAERPVAVRPTLELKQWWLENFSWDEILQLASGLTGWD